MAAATRQLKYGSVDGNLARKLDWGAREEEFRQAAEASATRKKEAVQPRVRSAAREIAREKQRVSVITVAGMALLGCMSVLILMSYVRLTALSADTVALKNQLAGLQTEHVTLTAEYQQMFDLATVKEAATAAGMAKPGSSQICYLDLSGEDSAVVYQKESSGTISQVLTSLNHGVYAVVEYFE